MQINIFVGCQMINRPAILKYLDVADSHQKVGGAQ
jgi:hypothetical protein